jgi:uncharacterized membrane protein YeaQ/YmgE (transglycosylase-associated protein family)
MEIVILIAAMVVVGLVIGSLAGTIWKGERPRGATVDYVASVVTCVIVGLLDWYVIPAIGFSKTITYIGVVFEPPLSALLVLWIIRKAKK